VRDPWRTTLPILVVLGTFCLGLWSVAGPTTALVVAAAVLLAMVLHHVHHAALLTRWLRDPLPEQVPQGRGAWDAIFAEFYRLLRRQRQSESQLTASLEDFRQAGAAMPDGLLILGVDDRIEWCNPVAERHFGLDHTRDLGQSVTNLVRRPQFVEYLHSQDYGEPLILRQVRTDDVVLAVQLIPYGERQKLVISRDITDRERLETMRRDFIANVSHELRTPLTVLCGFLETVTDTPDRDLLARALPLMTEQARRMQRLVEDLLTLSRLESSQDAPREERVDVPALVSALHHDALALSGGRHRITVDIACEDWVVASEEELRSAFSNLVSNAVRYTPERGEVIIAWRRRMAEAVFIVRDTGIGIAPEHVPRLTERFYRVDRSRSRETGGTGLGLAIVKHVLNRHQGRLEVESEPGRGSTFTAVLPAARVAAAGAHARTA